MLSGAVRRTCGAMLLLLVVVVVVAAGEARDCPPGCTCADGDEVYVQCARAGGAVHLYIAHNTYLKVECQGAVSCEWFPAGAVSAAGAVWSASLRGCPPSLVGCVGGVGAAAPTTLYLENSTAALPPDALRALPSVEKLIMRLAAHQHEVPATLSDLPRLHHLRVCGARPLHLAPLPPLPLDYLELSEDDLSSLPAGVFSNLHNLTVLNIWGNAHPLTVHEDSLQGLRSLRWLSFSSNNVSALPARWLADCPALAALTLTRNQLRALPPDLFSGLRALQNVTIQNPSHPLSLGVRQLAGLPALRRVLITEAGLSSLPAALFADSPRLSHLTLDHNHLTHLPPDLFSSLSSLEEVSLRWNRLTAVPPAPPSPPSPLHTLLLDHNLIAALPRFVFSGWGALRRVSLSYNALRAVEQGAFQGAAGITQLSLAHNQLVLEPPAALATYYETLQSPLSALTALQVLDLSHNRLRLVLDDFRYVMLQLRTLDLSYNNFTELTAADVHFSSDGVTVDLRHNRIESVVLGPAGPPAPPSNNTVLLDYNPLRCDCRLYELAMRLRGHGSLDGTPDPKYGVQQAHCATPPALQGQPLRAVPPARLVCAVPCGDGCHCEARPAARELHARCRNAAHLALEAAGGARVSLTVLDPPAALNLSSSVTDLSLSGLALSELPDASFANLSSLDLSSNEFTGVPDVLLRGDVRLRLAGNPLRCGCGDLPDVRRWLAVRERIEDLENVTCAGGTPLVLAEASDPCAALLAGVVGGCLALLGLAVAAVGFAWRYRGELTVWLWARGCRWLVDEEALDVDKQYDLFVSFAHEDAELVCSRLLPELEREYSVCVHHRDWLPGDMIPEQITRSVGSSRRTLVVVSRSFCASLWGLLELRVAQAASQADRRPRALLLLLEPDLLAASSDLHPLLRAHLATTTCLTWGEPQLFDKLRCAVPPRRRGEPPGAPPPPPPAALKLSRGLQVTLTPQGHLVNAAYVKDG